MVIGRVSGGANGVRLVDGLAESIAAINFLPGSVKKLSQQSAAAQVGKVVSAARRNFFSDIKRSNEQTDGSRLTSSAFTFGNGGAFQGRTFKLQGRAGFGFGFPDIRQADTQTRYVWRSLEHGLQGTRASRLKGVSTPTSLGLFELFPQGTHVLPKRYVWSDSGGAFGDGPVSGTAALILTKKGKERQRAGSGIDGKHFIEEAWLSQIPFIEKKYARAMNDAIEAAFKKK